MRRWRLFGAPLVALALLLAAVAPAAAQQAGRGAAPRRPTMTMTQPRRAAPTRATTTTRPAVTTARRATMAVRAARTADLDPTTTAAGLGLLGSVVLGGGLLLRRRTPAVAR